MTNQIKIKRLDNLKNLPIPSYGTKGSAGIDLCAAISKKIILKRGEYKLISTGIKIQLPKNYEAQIRPRSGLALKKGLTVLNSPGTVDSDYRGEIGIILINHGKNKIVIRHGMRIAQMVISKVSKLKLVEEKKLTKTTRGSGGFGSTGEK